MRETLGPSTIKTLTKFADSVLMARGVMMVQTVGLSKPVSLSAPSIFFINLIINLFAVAFIAELIDKAIISCVCPPRGSGPRLCRR